MAAPGADRSSDDEQSRQIICALDGKRFGQVLFGARMTIEIAPDAHTPLGVGLARIVAHPTIAGGWSAVSNASLAVTAATGLPTGTVPTSGNQLLPSAGYEQRQLEIGFRFSF